MDIATVLKQFLQDQQSQNKNDNWRALVVKAQATLSAWAEAGIAVKHAAEAVGNRAARS